MTSLQQFGEGIACTEYTSAGLGRDGLEGLCTAGGGTVLSGNNCSSGASLTCSGAQSGLGYKYYWYDIAADRVEEHRSHCVSIGGNPVESTTQTQPSDGFPSSVAPQSPPQASGRDVSGVEVAGNDSTEHVLVRNNQSESITYTRGTWLEPRDGEYQRMIISQTVTVPRGQLAEVPTACMQREREVPDRGIRFFSQAKSVSGPVQACQRQCLSSATDLQSCVWDCEADDQTSIPEPERNLFGAIAVVAPAPAGCVSRAAGWANDHSSRAEAESSALTECRSIAGGSATNCILAVSWQNSCGAYAEGDRCGIGFSSPSVHGTNEAARQGALEQCGQFTSNCRVRTSLCTSTSQEDLGPQETPRRQSGQDCAHLNDNPYSDRIYELNEQGLCECVPTATDPCTVSE